MRPELNSVVLDVDGRSVAAIRQHDPRQKDQARMLCVHGWLDNANSFMPMMPYLPGYDLVAIDLPGCGYSDALPQGYALHELCYQISQVVAGLGWDDCHLVGHSLGACIAPMLCVANPSMVKSLTLIEGNGPMSEAADKLPARMNRALQDRLHPQRYESRIFKDKQEAIDIRLKAAKMDPNSAKLIIDRQLLQVGGGYQWRFDPRWRMASAQYQTEEQVQSVLATVQCETLVIVADQGFLASRPETDSRIDRLQDKQVVVLPGHHHLHMDTPEPVAIAINRFLKVMPALGG